MTSMHCRIPLGADWKALLLIPESFNGDHRQISVSVDLISVERGWGNRSLVHTKVQPVCKQSNVAYSTYKCQAVNNFLITTCLLKLEGTV